MSTGAAILAAVCAILALVCAALGFVGLIAASDWLLGIIRCPGCDRWLRACTCRNRRKDGAR